jgi:hypothetical protein
MDLFKSKPTEEVKKPEGFRELLANMMARRWYITALVLGSFMLIIGSIFVAVNYNATMPAEWKELLFLMLGAFIGSYGKIIDYWFSDTDKDKMLVQKMDEEDGTTLSHTNDMKESNKPVAQRSRRSGIKKAELIKLNQQVINNVWTYLNLNQPKK